MDQNSKKEKTGGHPGKRAVIQLLDGQVIAKYPSAYLASKKTGIKACCITNVLCGRRKSTGGYNFIYAAEGENQ